MNIDMTRRTLLHLAGASSLTAAAAAAARAEGDAKGGGPTFASRTPMRVGMVTMRVRNVDLVADFYRDRFAELKLTNITVIYKPCSRGDQ